jgi:uncharacterized membrane protein
MAMGESKSQLCGLAAVLMLSAMLAGCNDGLVTVTYSADDTGRKMPAPKRAKREQCFGISRAQYNDGTAGCDDCAGTAPNDYMPDTWKYMPAGTCESEGGSLIPGIPSE